MPRLFLVEAGGKYYLTKMQKEMARVHEIDPVLLAGLWGSAERWRRAPAELKEGRA